MSPGTHQPSFVAPLASESIPAQHPVPPLYFFFFFPLWLGLGFVRFPLFFVSVSVSHFLYLVFLLFVPLPPPLVPEHPPPLLLHLGTRRQALLQPPLAHFHLEITQEEVTGETLYSCHCVHPVHRCRADSILSATGNRWLYYRVHTFFFLKVYSRTFPGHFSAATIMTRKLFFIIFFYSCIYFTFFLLCCCF